MAAQRESGAMSRELRDLGPVQPYRPRHRGATVTALLSSGPPAPRRPVGAVLAAAAAPPRKRRRTGAAPAPKAWAVAAAAALPPPQPSDPPGRRTIIGFGSLLSEVSARSTFPSLTHFRLGRVRGYRRVFAHPAGIFFHRAIANARTGEVSSLSAERDASTADLSFNVAVFEVPLGAAGDPHGALRRARGGVRARDGTVRRRLRR